MKNNYDKLVQNTMVEFYRRKCLGANDHKFTRIIRLLSKHKMINPDGTLNREKLNCFLETNPSSYERNFGKKTQSLLQELIEPTNK